jgi:hypothetical protein
MPWTVNIPEPEGEATFAAVALNTGAPRSFSVSINPRPPGASAGVSTSFCRTDAQGTCLAPPVSSPFRLTLTLDTGEVATFAVFVKGEEQIIPFDPVVNRISLLFTVPVQPHYSLPYHL